MRNCPTPSNAPKAGTDRRAFTVLEIMIVVAILGMIAAMTAPQLMSLVQESSVFREADSVREWMGEARRYAIDTGIDYEFRYELNGSNFVILPSEQELNVNENGQSTTTEKYVRIHQELAEDIHLKALEGNEERAESLEPECFAGLDATELSQISWSEAIVFCFDGTAQDFTLRVVDDEGITAEVKLRGLTGSVSTRAAEIYQEDN